MGKHQLSVSSVSMPWSDAVRIQGIQSEPGQGIFPFHRKDGTAWLVGFEVRINIQIMTDSFLWDTVLSDVRIQCMINEPIPVRLVKGLDRWGEPSNGHINNVPIGRKPPTAEDDNAQTS